MCMTKGASLILHHKRSQTPLRKVFITCDVEDKKCDLIILHTGNRIDHWARYSEGTGSRKASHKALKSTSEGLKQSKYLSGIACPQTWMPTCTGEALQNQESLQLAMLLTSSHTIMTIVCNPSRCRLIITP